MIKYDFFWIELFPCLDDEDLINLYNLCKVSREKCKRIYFPYVLNSSKEYSTISIEFWTALKEMNKFKCNVFVEYFFKENIYGEFINICNTARHELYDSTYDQTCLIMNRNFKFLKKYLLIDMEKFQTCILNVLRFWIRLRGCEICCGDSWFHYTVLVGMFKLWLDLFYPYWEEKDIISILFNHINSTQNWLSNQIKTKQIEMEENEDNDDTIGRMKNHHLILDSLIILSKNIRNYNKTNLRKSHKKHKKNISKDY